MDRPKIVFVESICRVQSLSLTGKILQYLPVHILVQWPQLTKLSPKTEYIGKLV
jgi:beta-1,4-N-acetylglucosaminyltransferase